MLFTSWNQKYTASQPAAKMMRPMTSEMVLTQNMEISGGNP